MQWIKQKIRTWFLQRRRQRRLVMRRHRVRCPRHGGKATITTRTRFWPRRHPRHVDVLTCSLLPAEPLVPPRRTVWVPDLPYFDLRPREAVPLPVYPLHVRCRKDCLHLLNDTLSRTRRWRERCVSGSSDALELEREATRNTVAETATTQAPWSYI